LICIARTLNGRIYASLAGAIVLVLGTAVALLLVIRRNRR